MEYVTKKIGIKFLKLTEYADTTSLGNALREWKPTSDITVSVEYFEYGYRNCLYDITIDKSNFSRIKPNDVLVLVFDKIVVMNENEFEKIFDERASEQGREMETIKTKLSHNDWEHTKGATCANANQICKEYNERVKDVETIKTNSDGDKVVECMASEYREDIEAIKEYEKNKDTEEFTSFDDVAKEMFTRFHERAKENLLNYDSSEKESETTFGIISYDVKASVEEYTRVNLDVLINKTGNKNTFEQVQELIDLISKQENVRSRTRGVK